jgi:hypothetical protein
LQEIRSIAITIFVEAKMDAILRSAGVLFAVAALRTDANAVPTRNALAGWWSGS